MKKVIQLSAVLAATIAPAMAANVIAAGGFETTVNPIPDNNGTDAWKAFQNGNTGNVAVVTTYAHTGTQSAGIDLLGDTNTNHLYLRSTLGGASAETTWNWSFWVMTLTETTTSTFSYSFVPTVGTNGTQTPTTGVSSGSVNLGNLDAGVWTQVSGTFTVTDVATSPTQIKFTATSGGSTNTTAFYIDDVSLEAVPEPSTAVAALGSLGLLALRRRRA